MIPGRAIDPKKHRIQVIAVHIDDKRTQLIERNVMGRVIQLTARDLSARAGHRINNTLSEAFLQ